MKIEKIELAKLKIPLKVPFITALRTVHYAEDIVVKITTDTGKVGWGSAPPTAVITGDSQASIIAAIKEIIAPQLIGRNIQDTEDLFAIINNSMLHNSSAKAAVDIAIHDLWAQMCNQPLSVLLGNYRKEIDSDLTISLMDEPTMAEHAKKAVARGYKDLKLKVGNEPLRDFQRVKAVREAVGPDIRIRLDANQGWKPKEAVRLIHQLEDSGLDIAFIEQPVVAHDFEGLKYVTDHVDTLIMADESAFGTQEVFQLLAMRACDLINIKLMKAGGIHNAVSIANMAAVNGVECMMGCMLESKIGITAAAALAGGKANISKADLDAADLLAEDPVQGGISYQGNKILVNDTPGLGIKNINNLLEI